MLEQGKFNTRTVRDFKPLTKENVFAELEEQNVFEFYFGSEIDLKKNYTNPLRPDDKSPGCKFFIGYSGKLLFIDFAKGKLYDVFEYICEKESVNLYGALMIINKDFRLGLGDPKSVYIPRKVIKGQTMVERIQASNMVCKKRSWQFYDTKYWSNYCISTETLEKFNVIPTESVYHDNRKIMSNTPEDPIYCYYFPLSGRKKIYRPLHKEQKYRFRSDPDIGITIQGWEQMPTKGELLIITKSLKDVMCLYELGYTAIAPHGENYELRQDIIDYLYTRFNRIIVIYDNDEAGLAAMERINEKFNLYCTCLPEYVAKDISDCVEGNGVSVTKYHLKQLIPDDSIYKKE